MLQVAICEDKAGQIQVLKTAAERYLVSKKQRCGHFYAQQLPCMFGRTP